MSRHRRRIVRIALSLLVFTPAVVAEEPEPKFDPKLYQALEYRNIGPFRGGRSTAVTGVIGERDTFYMGTTGGGVWKTTDGGETWRSIAGEYFGSASVGAVAVAPSDPNVVYAGMGSACIRGNTSPGDGVYRSTDAGESWEHVGLREAGQIGRIVVHPDDADVVWVAALGHTFGPNEERGVFRSRDGGKTWDRVLYVSERAGAVDLALNPANPRILFAASWEVERKPWTLESGGEGSGLHRSTDGGDTWEPVTEGLPEGLKGKIGVSVSGADPRRVYVLVEAEDGGLFRSDDGGEKFRLINPDRNFRQRAWYYTHVFADPQDRETVYIANVALWRSHDAGKTFEIIRVPHGDNHALWIDPTDNRVLINGNDGGANVSYNGGKTWSTQKNQPTAEMYRVSVDDRFPYHVYGCQQDNSCVSVPSRTAGGAITWQDWYEIGGCESGHVAIDPRDPDVTYSGCYGGSIERYDHRTRHRREIMTYPQVALGQKAEDLRYRFQWNAPIRLSPHDPDVLYHTSQFVHRSLDEGQTWEVISPDLSRDDKSKQDYAGGPITRDNTGVEVYGTVFAFEESPLVQGLLWAGTDDGRVHLSRDAGKSWEEITPRRMPAWGQVNMIELSVHDAARAFLAVTRYRMDDFKPYIFRTDDYGKTWNLLTDDGNGIPEDHFVRVVREDPDRKGLLYAGTEFGMYVSFDDGERWQSLQLKLPVTPITDLAVTRDDLVVATQGRSFWILDDLTPLRRLDDEVAGAERHLFAPRETVLFGGGFGFGPRGADGKNPPAGVLIHYTFAKEPDEEVTLEMLDAAGDVLRTFSSKNEERRAPNPWLQFIPELATPRLLPAEEGMNRYVWDLRLPDAELVDDAVLWGMARGPQVPPGTYRVRLTVGDRSETRSFEVVADPRLGPTARTDLEARFELARKTWLAMTDSHRAIRRLRDVRQQVDDLVRRLGEAGQGEGLEDAAEKVNERLDGIERRLTQPDSEAPQDVLNFPPALDGQWLGLQGAIETGEARPTAGALQRYDDLRAELDSVLADLEQVFETELTAFNDLVRSKDVPPVVH